MRLIVSNNGKVLVSRKNKLVEAESTVIEKKRLLDKLMFWKNKTKDTEISETTTAEPVDVDHDDVAEQVVESAEQVVEDVKSISEVSEVVEEEPAVNSVSTETADEQAANVEPELSEK